MQIRSLSEKSSPEPAGKLPNAESRSRDDQNYVFSCFLLHVSTTPSEIVETQLTTTAVEHLRKTHTNQQKTVETHYIQTLEHLKTAVETRENTSENLRLPLEQFWKTFGRH